MAVIIHSNDNSRFTDLCDEPVDHLLIPIRGYEDQPLLSLSEAIEPVSGFFNGIENNVFVALHNCQNPADDLTQQESASIHLYTMGFHGGRSLYLLLNQALRAENRDDLKPWFSFLKLFLTALYKLPSQRQTVYRGVKNVDLSSIYTKGTKFVWWGVSSCTTDIEVLKSKKFLGETGQRTLFSIECINGKSIANHSYYKNKEEEIILMPGSYFEVIGQLNPAPQLHFILLREITPPKPPFPKSNIKPDTKWKQVGITVAGGNSHGDQLNQLSFPEGIFIDENQTIYIANWGNHRIVEWKSNTAVGQIVAGGNGQGNQMNQLDCPTDVVIDQKNNSFIIADQGNRRVTRWSRQNNLNREVIISDISCYGLTMDKNGSIYVSDTKKNEARRWKRGEKNGTIVAGGNGKGDQLYQLSCPTYLFVDEEYSLYVSDRDNHRVMKWLKDATEGIVVAGGNSKGSSLRQLSSPKGVIVDQSGHIYVADCGNHRVMRWCQGSKEGTIVVGGNGKGQQSNQFNGPVGLLFDQQGNIYVADCFNHRIQKFEIDENENSPLN